MYPYQQQPPPGYYQGGPPPPGAPPPAGYVVAPPPGYPGGPPPPGAPPPAAYGAQPGAPPSYGAPPAAPPAGQPPAGAAAASDPAQVDLWFASIDSDRSGFLDAKELQQALALGNLRFSITDVDAMVRAFEKGDERKLNKEEFGRLHAFLTGVQASFSYFDKDRTNSLGQDEVAAALKQTGFNLDPPVLAAMISKHDPDNSKNLSLDEFIRLCLFLQSCVRTFSAFDPQRQGRITLDFGQFVYCIAHIN